MRRRERPLALVYLLVVGLLGVAATRADRYPVGAVWVGLALLEPPLGAGLIGRGWWLLALVPVPPVVAFLSVYVVGEYDLRLVFFYGAGGGPRRARPAAARRRGRQAGWTLAAPGWPGVGPTSAPGTAPWTGQATSSATAAT